MSNKIINEQIEIIQALENNQNQNSKYNNFFKEESKRNRKNIKISEKLTPLKSTNLLQPYFFAKKEFSYKNK